MIKSTDILAKLLANENVTIIRSNSRTASFNIKTRVLNLPQWKDMSPEIEEMMICHEVGHALFTTESGYLKSLEKLKLKGAIYNYANVVEDVRIERKMRDVYPGCRKTFFIGYKALNDRDFFEVKNRSLRDYNLIDRINLYYKVGYSCGVRFTEAEREFLMRAEKTETEEDVVQLAKDIYEFSKTQAKTNRDKLKSMIGDVQEDSQDDEDDFSQNYLSSDDEDSEPDSNGSEDSEDSEDKDGSSEGDSEDSEDKDDASQNQENHGSSEGDSDEDESLNLDSKTYNTLKSKIEDMTDPSTQIRYVEPEFYVKRTTSSTIVPYNVILESIEKQHSSYGIHVATLIKNSSSSTLKASSNVVSYLIKEFEMKKAATAYKYAKTAKLWQLDGRKLYAYKLKDDIFRQITRVQDAKNHGMIFLLDWSGSMHDYIDETIEQVINLAMFCHRAQIPFQVFAFSDRFYSREIKHAGLFNEDQYLNINKSDKGIGDERGFNLLELFSDKMTSSELNKMSVSLTNRAYLPHTMDLGSTPLNDALVFMTKYVGEFIRRNSVEKMTFVTLTDGESSNLKYHSGNLTRGTIGITIGSEYKVVKCRSYLLDPITKKEYNMGHSASAQTDALLSLIKDRYSCKNLGFYVVKNSEREISRFWTNNGTSSPEKVMKTRVEMRQNGHAILKGMVGRDEFYLLDSKNLQVEYGSLDRVDSTSSSREIAKNFNKLMNTRKTSRVVLNRFIDQVS